MKKFLVCLCVICMVFSQGVVALAYGGDNEPNDNMSEANPVEIEHKVTKVYGVVGSDDDEDWFKINSSVSGPCKFWLFYDEIFDADIYLYNSYGNLIMKGEELFWDDGGKFGSSIKDYYIRSGKTYYLKVEYNSGVLKSPYELRLNIPR